MKKTFKALSIFIVVLFISFQGIAKENEQQKKVVIENIIQNTNLESLVNQLPYFFTMMIDLNKKNIPTNYFSPLKEKIMAKVTPDMLQENIIQALINEMTLAELSKIDKWYKSVPGKRIIAVEKIIYDEKLTELLSDFIKQKGIEKISPEREKLVHNIIKKTESLDQKQRLSIRTQIAIFENLSEMLPKDNPPIDMELVKDSAYEQQKNRRAKTEIYLNYLYTFGYMAASIGDLEIHKFFIDSKTAIKYNRIVFEALLQSPYGKVEKILTDLKVITAQINEHLPIMVSKEIQLDKATYEKDTLIYHCKFLTVSSIDLDPKEFKETMFSSLKKSTCQNGNISRLINKGTNVKYKYLGNDLLLIAEIVIPAYSCK